MRAKEHHCNQMRLKFFEEDEKEAARKRDKADLVEHHRMEALSATFAKQELLDKLAKARSPTELARLSAEMPGATASSSKLNTGDATTPAPKGQSPAATPTSVVTAAMGDWVTTSAPATAPPDAATPTPSTDDGALAASTRGELTVRPSTARSLTPRPPATPKPVGSEPPPRPATARAQIAAKPMSAEEEAAKKAAAQEEFAAAKARLAKMAAAKAATEEGQAAMVRAEMSLAQRALI